MSIYTKSERTVKKYSAGWAFYRAKDRLKKAGYGNESICCNAYREMKIPDDSTLLTLEEANQLIDRLYYDTLYYM